MSRSKSFWSYKFSQIRKVEGDKSETQFSQIYAARLLLGLHSAAGVTKMPFLNAAARGSRPSPKLTISGHGTRQLTNIIAAPVC